MEIGPTNIKQVKIEAAGGEYGLINSTNGTVCLRVSLLSFLLLLGRAPAFYYSVSSPAIASSPRTLSLCLVKIERAALP